MKKIIEFLKTKIIWLRVAMGGLLLSWFLLSQIQVAPGFLSSLFLILGLLAVASVLILDGANLVAFFREKRVKTGLGIWVGLILLAIILAGLYFLFNRHLPLRADLTANKRYSLSEQTELVLKNLEEPVKFYLFEIEIPKSGNPFQIREFEILKAQLEVIQEVLEDYRRKSDLVSFEVVDFREVPSLVKLYQVRTPFTIVAVAGEKSQEIRPEDYLTQQYLGGRPQLVPQHEESLTTAIRALTRQRVWRIVFTAGHQELDPWGDQVNKATLLHEGLVREGYSVAVTNLILAGGVPSETDLVVVAGPKDDLSLKELEYLEAWLMEGGPAILMGDRDSGPLYREFLARWGAELGHEAVIDPSRLLRTGGFMPAIEPHRITRTLYEAKRQVALGLSVALKRSGFAAERYDENGSRFKPYSIYPLLSSSDESWGEKDYDLSQGISHDPGEERGPFTTAMAITVWPASAELVDGQTNQIAGPARELSLAIIGNSDFASDFYLGEFPPNLEFFLNVTRWTLGEVEQIAIPPKTLKDYPLNLTAGERNFIGWFSLLVLPLAVIITGIVIYYRRKSYGKA